MNTNRPRPTPLHFAVAGIVAGLLTVVTHKLVYGTWGRATTALGTAVVVALFLFVFDRRVARRIERD